jgi:hypothetical protein
LQYISSVVMRAKSMPDVPPLQDFLPPKVEAHRTLGTGEICGARISTWRIQEDGNIRLSRTEK